MKKTFLIFAILVITGSFAIAQEDAINTENGEVEQINVKIEKNEKGEKQPTSAQLVKQHQKIEKLEYSKRLKQRELVYYQKKLEQKKKELEKFNKKEAQEKTKGQEKNNNQEETKGEGK